MPSKILGSATNGIGMWMKANQRQENFFTLDLKRPKGMLIKKAKIANSANIYRILIIFIKIANFSIFEFYGLQKIFF
jgi:AmiR/NasT family two-component response regulator